MLCATSQIHNMTASVSQRTRRRTSIVSKFLKRKEDELSSLVHKGEEVSKRKKCASDNVDAFPLLSLPEEIIIHVLSFLDFTTVLACCASKRLYTVINDTNWLWRALFEGAYLSCVAACKLNKCRRGAKKLCCVDWKKECVQQTKIDGNWKKGLFTENTFRGHMDWVRCLQFEDDKLFSGSADKSLKIWNVSTQQCAGTLLGHSRCINCLSYDGDLLASACSAIKIWDVAPFVNMQVNSQGVSVDTPTASDDTSITQCKSTLRGHEDCIWCIQLCGSRVVSGSSDRTIRVWNLEVETCVQVLTGHVDCVCCLRLIPGSDLLLSGSSDSTVRCYDLRTKECVTTMQTLSDRVWCLQYENNILVTGSSDRTVKVWDFRTNKCIKALVGHTNSVWALQMEGNKLVSGSADSTVRVWDLKSDPGSACISVIKPNVGCVECLQFEGERLVCGSSDSVIKMYNFL